MAFKKTGKGMRALVTGGAGFIGSHLSEALVKGGWDVVVLDNLSSGSRKNLNSLLDHPANHTKLIVGDCCEHSDVRAAVKDVDIVFHFAANPEVRMELNDPATCFRQNTFATQVMLEEFESSSASMIVFPSTSTVYGEARLMPTPEDFSPLEPISVYAGSKLASEALIASSVRAFNKRAIILRLANVVGPRSTHGVARDFALKLTENPHHLAILGDGEQTKSYIHVEDCIRAILAAYSDSQKQVEVFNVASEDQISVRKIARIITEEMKLPDVKMTFTGGPEGRGWVGDVKNMLLDIGRLRSSGWEPKFGSEEAIRRTIRQLLVDLAPIPRELAPLVPHRELSEVEKRST